MLIDQQNFKRGEGKKSAYPSRGRSAYLSRGESVYSRGGASLKFWPIRGALI